MSRTAKEIQNLVFLRRHEVEARTGLARSTIYERVKGGTFPAPVPLGAKAVGWVEAEIEAWAEACIAGRKAA